VRSLSSGGITDRSANPTHLGAEGKAYLARNSTQLLCPCRLRLKQPSLSPLRESAPLHTTIASGWYISITCAHTPQQQQQQDGAQEVLTNYLLNSSCCHHCYNNNNTNKALHKPRCRQTTSCAEGQSQLQGWNSVELSSTPCGYVTTAMSTTSNTCIDSPARYSPWS